MTQTKEGFATYLTLLWFFLVFLVYYIIKIYAYPKNFPWHSYAAIFLTYYCSLGLMLIVPLDVSVTILCRRSEGASHDYDHTNKTLSKMYTSFYIPATILGSYFMFMQEEYLRQGAFTVGGRIYGVAKAVGLQMVGGIAFMMILFAILVSQKVATANGGAVMLALVLLNNTIYLVMLMLFLGYGLVALPLSLWEKGNLEGELKRSEHKAAVRYKYLGETTIVMGKAVADVMKTNESLERQLVEYPEYELADAMKIVLSECPKDFHSSTLGTVCADKKGRVTLDTLAVLRGRLYLTVSDYFMAKAKVEEASKSAYYHEDLIASLRREDQIKKIKWSFKDEGTEREYYWEIWYKPILYRVSAILVGILSLFSYLGILGSIPNLDRRVSVYDHAVHSPHTSGGGVVVFILVTLCYTAYASLWSIFQMKISGMMELLPGQKTWPNSLSVNARVCAKFVAPTVFFYLSWISENGTTTGSWTTGHNGKLMLTAFAEFYQIQVIPVIGDRFNLVFPVMIFIISFLVATNSINRALVMLGMHSMQFGSEILSAEQLIEGRRQLDRHKRLMERATRRASLKEKIQSNFGGVTKPSENEPPQKSWSDLLFWKKKSAYEAAADVVDEIEEPEEVKPDLLRGWGERKDEKSRLTSGWNKRYIYVVEPGLLHFKKDPENEKESEPIIDLRNVQHISLVEEKTDKFGPRLVLEIPSSSDIRLRFSSSDDAEIWRSGLEQWKEYALKHSDQFQIEEEESVEISQASNPSRSRVESTHNPLSINVVKEDNNYEETDQQLSSPQNDEENLGDKTKKKKRFSSFLSIIKPKSHQPIPTDNIQSDIENQSIEINPINTRSPNTSINHIQTTSPFHKPNNNNSSNNVSNSSSPISPSISSTSSLSPAITTKNMTSPNKSSSSSIVSPPLSLSLDSKPDKLEGWLEKKNKGGIGSSLKLGHGWNRRYFRVLEKTGQIAYYSSDKEASINPSESSDLKLAIDIIDRKDANRFDIIFEGSTLQLKASSPEEKDRWINGLNEWKDYFLMNMC